MKIGFNFLSAIVLIIWIVGIIGVFVYAESNFDKWGGGCIFTMIASILFWNVSKK